MFYALPVESRAVVRRFTRFFQDADLETAYRADVAKRSLLHYRIVIPVVLILWIAVLPFDAILGGSSENTEVLMMLRIAVVPGIAFCTLLGYMSSERFLRWFEPAVAVALALALGALMLMIALVPDPAVHDSRQTVAGIILASVASYAIFPLRPIFVAIPTITVNAALIVVLFVRTDHALISTLWLVMANVVGIMGDLMVDHFRRRVFITGILLDEEKAKSDQLLHNLLPASIAARLRNNPNGIAERHDEVTVLFADIVGFTPLAQELEPEELVSTLDRLFTGFDEMVEQLGLEKIKTIGDAYMAAGGVPLATDEHAKAVTDLGLQMIKFIEEFQTKGGKRLSLRVGVHSGTVVAGVIGKQRLVYDLWGDTVNVASRMESHGVKGKVQISAATAGLLPAGKYALEERSVDVKGKGMMTAFVVTTT